MSAETVLTDAQIFDCFDRQCSEMVINFDADELYPVGRAIEQAVLQSAEVQAWVEEAEHLRRELKVATDLAKQRLDASRMSLNEPSPWPLTPSQFATASESIAMGLAELSGYEGDDKHRLVWEFGASKPCGERWQKYIPEAQQILSLGIEGIQEQERISLTHKAIASREEQA